jgi:hypothetical protein
MASEGEHVPSLHCRCLSCQERGGRDPNKTTAKRSGPLPISTPLLVEEEGGDRFQHLFKSVGCTVLSISEDVVLALYSRAKYCRTIWWPSLLYVVMARGNYMAGGPPAGISGQENPCKNRKEAV